MCLILLDLTDDDADVVDDDDDDVDRGVRDLRAGVNPLDGKPQRQGGDAGDQRDGGAAHTAWCDGSDVRLPDLGEAAPLSGVERQWCGQARVALHLSWSNFKR